MKFKFYSKTCRFIIKQLRENELSTSILIYWLMFSRITLLCLNSSSDLWLSWGWERSSWGLCFSSSSSLCGTRPKWTLCSMVQSH